jgi:hypothetical protein
VIPEPLGNLIVAGLALLLIMLRLDAERFGAAEYDEALEGRLPSFRRRMAWYILGVTLVLAMVVIHPRPREDLFLGTGDRVAALVGGFLFGVVGAAQAVAFSPNIRRIPKSAPRNVASSMNAVAIEFTSAPG